MAERRPASESRVSVRLLGPFEATDREGKPLRFRTRQTAALFAFLAFHADRPFRRAELAETFWPEATPEGARQSLRTALSSLRTTLGPDADGLRSEGDDVRLSSDGVQTDVSDFFRLCEEARQASGQAKSDVLRRAVGLVRGELLGGDADWAVNQWLRIEEAYAGAVVDLARELTAGQRHAEAIEVGKAALALLGCREDVHVAVMEAYIASGSPSLALAQFEQLERDLEEAWGEPPSERAWRLIETMPRGRAAQAAPVPPTLPETKARVFGRDEDARRLVEILSEDGPSRLVTLHGPGGCGKTTLALTVARLLDSRFAGRVWFVDLVPLDDPAGFWPALARDVCDGSIEPAHARGAVVAALRHAPALVVLDNLEQVLPDVAGPVGDLLAAAPGAVVLATSRVLLRLTEERVFTVGPLAVPDGRMTLDALQQIPAVAMFVDRARAVNDQFRLTPLNAQAVARLCVELQGLPLSLELAAARARSQTPAQMLAELGDLLRFLVARGRTGDHRHRSLRAAIEWSHALLGPEERDLWASLSVLRGSFDEAAAQGVCPGQDVRDGLEALTESSLLQVDVGGDTARFRLLEPLREFAWEHLEAAGRVEAALRAHFEYHRDSLLRTLRGRTNPSDTAWVGVLGATEDNLFAALEAALDGTATPDEATDYAKDLFEYAWTSGSADRLRPLVQTLHDEHGESLSILHRAVVKLRLASLWASKGDVTGNGDLLEAAVETFKALDERAWLARALRTRGTYLKTTGRYEESLVDLQAARALCIELGDTSAYANTVYQTALSQTCLGRYDEALELFFESLAAGRNGTNPETLTRILFDTSSALSFKGRYDEALILLAEAAETGRRTRNRRLQGLVAWTEAEVFENMGRSAEALASAQESVRLVLEAGFESGLKWIGLTVARVLASLGDTQAAVRWLGKLVTGREAEGRPLAAYESDQLDPLVDQAKATLGTAFATLWAQGAASSWDELVHDLHSTPRPDGAPEPAPTA